MKTGAVIRQAVESDLAGLMELYTHLHNNPLPPLEGRVTAVWQEMLENPRQRVIVAELDGRVVSSCVLAIVPNLTRGQRPFALIENVVTAPAHEGQGLGSACLVFAVEEAQKAGCYKVMLLTGSKNERTLNFYRRAGFNSEDKTAFIRWL